MYIYICVNAYIYIHIMWGARCRWVCRWVPLRRTSRAARLSAAPAAMLLFLEQHNQYTRVTGMHERRAQFHRGRARKSSAASINLGLSLNHFL